MNLLELLKKELENYGKNWSTLEKAQYLYVRTGELFQYDDRWLFATNNKLKDEILNKKIDIDNILENKIVCKAWSILYKELADKLLGNCTAYSGTSIIEEKSVNYYLKI